MRKKLLVKTDDGFIAYYIVYQQFYKYVSRKLFIFLLNELAVNSKL